VANEEHNETDGPEPPAPSQPPAPSEPSEPAEPSGPPEPPLKLVRYPEELLRAERLPISDIDYPGGLEALARDMLETMYASKGVGLAGPQVGINARIAVIDPSPERDQAMVLIDPEIVERSGVIVEEEGCLSVPGVNGNVKRASRVVVEYTDLSGERRRVEAEGLPARVFQHEIDHLDGKLFIDRLGIAKKLIVRKQLARLEEAAERRKAEE